MKVFVTGSSSAIGTSLLAALQARGHGAVAFDLQPAFHPLHGVAYFRDDVRDVDAVDRAAAGCDAGIHLAVRANDHNATEVMTVNVLGAYAFFRAAQRHGFRSVVLASSAPVHLPSASNDNDDLLRTDAGDTYDLSKKLQEVIAQDFHTHGLPVICLRFGHVVRGANETTLAGASLDQLPYCRGGWVALEDVVAGCLAALESAGPRTFEVYNLVGSRSGRDRFNVAEAEQQLGIRLAYDFSRHEPENEL